MSAPGSATFLHIGDLIALLVFEDGSGGLAGADGFKSVTLGIPNPNDSEAGAALNTSIFVVRQQQNYTVTKQIRTYLEKEGITAQEAQAYPRYVSLMEAREQEK